MKTKTRNQVKVRTQDTLLIADEPLVKEIMDDAQRIAPFTAMDMKIYLLCHHMIRTQENNSND